ncbi:MAG: hypothetical protein WD278_11015 [Pirellulales bacterium]
MIGDALLLGLLLARVNHLWFALPLIVVVSLVYAATRHEQMEQIGIGAVRIGAWISAFMLVVFAVLVLVSSLV